MTKPVLILVSCTLMVSCGKNACKPNDKKVDQIKVTYPVTQKDSSVKDDYFGTVINDPYRWLENDTTAETKKWVEAQNEVTFGYLKQITYRDKIKNRLT